MFSLFDTIQSHLSSFQNQLYTCCPAVVESYDPSESTVDVYPAIYKAEIDGLLIKDELLERVPLHFQATKELGITFPIKKGDTVLIVFGQSDTENWLTSPDQFVKPPTYRKHDINDAFAICGVFKYDQSPVQTGTENDLNIRYKGSYVRIKENGDIVINTPNGQDLTLFNNNSIEINCTDTITINSPTTNINGDVNIIGFLTTEGFTSNDSIGAGIATFKGTVEITGDVTADVGGTSISLLSHTHTGDSGGSTSPPN